MRATVTTSTTELDTAIERAQQHLLSLQADDGHWVGELEADCTITSEYLVFCRVLGLQDPGREGKIVRYLRRVQGADGGFALYAGGPGHLSATIKAYLALKLAGVPADDPAAAAARAFVRQRGGPPAANVFTKILLATLGEYDWAGVPAMPAEIMLLPRWSYFNLGEVSYWSRTVIVPLLVLLDRKPVFPLAPEHRLDELWVVPRERASLRFPRVSRPFSARTFLWKSVFITVDDSLKAWERAGPRPFRARALEAARRWLEERLAVPGGLGGIFPAMTNAVLALRLLGYPLGHPLVAGQLREIEGLVVEEAEELRCQPCLSPAWDTGLAVNALVESGCPADHPQLLRAGEWLLARQITGARGDWSVKRPRLRPGGWPFQYANDFYPDLDDTAMILMGLVKLEGLDPGRARAAVDAGVEWFLGMQGADGGWGSFDVDNNRLVFNNIPFADHGALLDPSTEDLTGRGVELLGTLGHDATHPAARRGLAFLRRTQTADGAWYGRWGVNYLYGTWSVLRGLGALGEGGGDAARRAARWLAARQNADGGWGETLASYDDPALAGRGESIPSQTAWALLGLLAAGEGDSPAVARGVQHLLATQDRAGTWTDPLWNGTGFPRVFYLRYHLYAKYFPLWALGVYRRARS